MNRLSEASGGSACSAAKRTTTTSRPTRPNGRCQTCSDLKPINLPRAETAPTQVLQEQWHRNSRQLPLHYAATHRRPSSQPYIPHGRRHLLLICRVRGLRARLRSKHLPCREQPRVTCRSNQRHQLLPRHPLTSGAISRGRNCTAI